MNARHSFRLTVAAVTRQRPAYLTALFLLPTHRTDHIHTLLRWSSSCARKSPAAFTPNKATHDDRYIKDVES